MKYRLKALGRGYITKTNGKKRTLGTPTVVDRVKQQATSQAIIKIYQSSDYSYTFRPRQNAHDVLNKCWNTSWIIDLDII